MASPTYHRRRGRIDSVSAVDSEASLDSTFITHSSLGRTYTTWRTQSQGRYRSRAYSGWDSTTKASETVSTASACSVCDRGDPAPINVALRAFCLLPVEILESIFELLCVQDRISLYQVLSCGKYLSVKAKQALSSASTWRRLKLLARRPDHLVTRPPQPGELLLPFYGPAESIEQLLEFFPPNLTLISDTDQVREVSFVHLKLFALRKHSFFLPFASLLEVFVTRGACSAVRSLSFAVEEIWQPDFYPLQRSDSALDRVTQLVDQLGPQCREVNVVKWPRLQDDTLIDATYSEMQAHYATTDKSTTDPILALANNHHLYANLQVLGLFWFDHEDPEFWSMARSKWCLTSHQWVWSEEEFSSGHTLYLTQATREYAAVDGLFNLKELRLTFSAYSNDTAFLHPSIMASNELTQLKVMIRASWLGWESVHAEIRTFESSYWPDLTKHLPNLRVTLTFIEFFDILKFDVPERVFHKAVPVACCQWLPGALVTLNVLNCISVSHSNTLTRLDIHCEVVDDKCRGDILLLLADVIRILRSLRSLTQLIYDSSITLHFCKVVARLRKLHWCQLVFFKDRILDCSEIGNEDDESVFPSLRQDVLLVFERGISHTVRRKWRFHDHRDREYGPRGYKG